MIPIRPARGWKAGRFQVVASSHTAKGEWDDFVTKIPKAMKRVYERLSECPLDVAGSRQFPLKGKRNKPFWEYEISAGDRLYYAVDLTNQVVVVVAVLSHATRSTSMVGTVQDRRDAFDGLIAEQEKRIAVPRPSEVTRPAKRRRKKKP